VVPHLKNETVRPLNYLITNIQARFPRKCNGPKLARNLDKVLDADGAIFHSLHRLVLHFKFQSEVDYKIQLFQNNKLF